MAIKFISLQLQLIWQKCNWLRNLIIFKYSFIYVCMCINQENIYHNCNYNFNWVIEITIHPRSEIRKKQLISKSGPERYGLTYVFSPYTCVYVIIQWRLRFFVPWLTSYPKWPSWPWRLPRSSKKGVAFCCVINKCMAQNFCNGECSSKG